jgi:hypothetical protein
MDPDQNIGALQAALPYINDMNQLALVMLGGNQNYDTGDLDKTVQWLGNYVGQGMTPGGSYANFNQGLGNLMGADTGGSNLGPLASYLQIADPGGQVDAFNSLAVPLANASLHPLWARAFQDELNRQGAAYVSRMTGGTTNANGFNDFLAGRGFSGY